MIKAIFFDVANTLLYKPSLFDKMVDVFESRGIAVDKNELAFKHKILSEAIEFPDRTSEEFYKMFNGQVLLSLGIAPEDQLLSELFLKCSYLPWSPFQDAEVLSLLKVPLGVISNWDNRLETTLKAKFTVGFKWVLGSQLTGLRKPGSAVFMKAIEMTGFAANEIMMVGDSIKLDIVPAERVGMRPVLVDRAGVYPCTPYRKVSSLFEVEKLLLGE